MWKNSDAILNVRWVPVQRLGGCIQEEACRRRQVYGPIAQGKIPD